MNSGIHQTLARRIKLAVLECRLWVFQESFFEFQEGCDVVRPQMEVVHEPISVYLSILPAFHNQSIVKVVITNRNLAKSGANQS